jgi:hypothetical protein
MHDMDHLVNAWKEHYTIAVNMTGSLVCGIHLTWNYSQGHINCHMPRYINKALTKYQHPKPVSPQHAPFKVAPIQYGAWVQRVEVNTTQPLTPKEIKHVQDIIGTLLYYARSVDPTLLAALSAIAACQSNGTQTVADACHQLLDYVATHPNAGIRYKACNMVHWYTRTCHTFRSPVVKVEQQVISTYPIAMTKTSTLEPFSPCLLSSNMSCRQLPRLNLPHFTTAATLPPHFNHTRGTWLLPTNSHSCHHQPHHCPRPHNGINDSQGLQIIRSTLSLAQMSICTTPIPVSLAERYPQLCRLLQQTCTKTSSK